MDRGGEDKPALSSLLLFDVGASSTRAFNSGAGWRVRGVVSSVSGSGRGDAAVVTFDVVLGRVRVCWGVLANRGYLRLWASSSDNRRSNW